MKWPEMGVFRPALRVSRLILGGLEIWVHWRQKCEAMLQEATINTRIIFPSLVTDSLILCNDDGNNFVKIVVQVLNFHPS